MLNSKRAAIHDVLIDILNTAKVEGETEVTILPELVPYLYELPEFRANTEGSDCLGYVYGMSIIKDEE